MNLLVRILLVVAALCSASMACVMNLGGPALPTETIPASPDLAAQVEEEFKTAIENAHNGDGSVTLTLTEAEMTSLLASRLAAETDPVITDPQVFLRDGEIQVFGRAQRGLFAATVGIVASVGVDDQGRPSLSLISADFGPLPAPEGLAETISGFVNEAYTSTLGPVATGFRLEAVSIGDGQLTLSGRVR